MIEVKASNGKLTIVSTVSEFCDSMGYCEYKIPLTLQGVKPPPTEATIEGSKAHLQQQQYEKEHFELEQITCEELVDIQKDIEFAYESVSTRLIKTINLSRYPDCRLWIYGRADKVYRSQGTLIVEESKFPFEATKYLQTFEPYPDHKLQTLLYLNSLFASDNSFNSKDWFEIPHKKKAWIINIKDKKTGQPIKTFRGMQTSDLEQYMNHCLKRFAQIAAGELQPKHHHKQAKCEKCRIKTCKHSICSK